MTITIHFFLFSKVQVNNAATFINLIQDSKIYSSKNYIMREA
jgi:hypothetical protein